MIPAPQHTPSDRIELQRATIKRVVEHLRDSCSLECLENGSPEFILIDPLREAARGDAQLMFADGEFAACIDYFDRQMPENKWASSPTLGHIMVLSYLYNGQFDKAKEHIDRVIRNTEDLRREIGHEDGIGEVWTGVLDIIIPSLQELHKVIDTAMECVEACSTPREIQEKIGSPTFQY